MHQRLLLVLRFGFQANLPVRPLTGYKEVFFYCLQRFMEEGRLKLSKNGLFLTGSVEELLANFKVAFPRSEQELDIAAPGAIFWFHTDDCPGSAVWLFKGENGEDIFDWT